MMTKIHLMVAITALLAFTSLLTMYLTVRFMPPKVIVQHTHSIEYRDTCDSKFFKTIAEIESGAVTLSKKDSCYLSLPVSGEDDKGRGHFGIYDICVKGTGFHRVLGYTHEDMFELEKSSHVFWAMMGIFVHTHYAKTGEYPTYEQLARKWAGGPNGHVKPTTNKYATKFNKIWQSTL